MGSTNVEYIISLKDLLSGKIKDIDTHAKTLDATMHTLKGTLGALGIATGISSVMHYFESAVESAHKLHEAEAQVKAGLESTGGAAKVSFEELEKAAGRFSSHMKASKAEVMDLQAQLLTFGGVTRENFDGITEATLNIAARIHRGTTEMAIMMGKAFDNPAEGLRKLMRAGVMFDEQEKKRIEMLVAKGHIVEAQQVMLKEIESKYGGSAVAEFNADPAAQYKKAIGAIKREIGEGALELEHELIPALQWFAKTVKEDIIPGIKTFFHFLKDNKGIIIGVAQSLGILFLTFKTVNITKNILDSFSSIKKASENTAGSVKGFSRSISDLLGPLGLAVTAVAALIPVLNALYEKSLSFRAITDGLRGDSSSMVEWWANIFGKEESQASVESKNAASTSIPGINSMFDVKDKYSDEFSLNPKLLGKNKKKELIGTGNADFQKRMLHEQGGVGGVGGKQEKKGATGNRSVTINISINKMVEKFTVGVTNVHEAANKVKDHFLEMMTSAINDSQTIASNL